MGTEDKAVSAGEQVLDDVGAMIEADATQVKIEKKTIAELEIKLTADTSGLKAGIEEARKLIEEIAPNGDTNLTVSAKDVRPIDDKIVVRPDEAPKTSKGGIHLPEQAAKKWTCSTVLAVGPGRVADDGYHIKLEIKVGDRIMHHAHVGIEAELGDEKVIIMAENDVMVILASAHGTSTEDTQ